MVNPARLIGLLLLAALLGWILWEASWSAEPLPGISATTTAIPAPPRAPASLTAPLDDYTATLARPLFYPGRVIPSEDAAPSPIPGVVQHKPVQSTARLTLSAIIEEDGQRTALLIAPGQATSTRLREGESIGGWRLESIGDASVSVISNGRQETLQLRQFDAAPPPRPAAAIQNRPRPPRVTGGISKRRRTE